jgi:hypothetical protein
MRDLYHCGSYGITICAQRRVVGPGYQAAEGLIFTLPDGAVVTLKE